MRGIIIFFLLTQKNGFQNKMHITVKPIIFAYRAHLLEHETNNFLKTAYYIRVQYIYKHFNCRQPSSLRWHYNQGLYYVSYVYAS